MVVGRSSAGTALLRQYAEYGGAHQPRARACVRRSRIGGRVAGRAGGLTTASGSRHPRLHRLLSEEHTARSPRQLWRRGAIRYSPHVFTGCVFIEGRAAGMRASMSIVAAAVVAVLGASVSTRRRVVVDEDESLRLRRGAELVAAVTQGRLCVGLGARHLRRSPTTASSSRAAVRFQ